MIYLWVLVALIAALAALCFWWERRHERSLKDFVERKSDSHSTRGPWQMMEFDGLGEDTAPSVLDHREPEQRLQSGWRR